MTRWDIAYADALGVVQRAAGKASDYQADLVAVETAATGLTTALGNSALVQSAVNGFAVEVAAPELQRVVGHTDSAIRGTATAVNAYQAGQLEMAAVAQANAAAAVYPADLPGGGSARAAAGPGGR